MGGEDKDHPILLVVKVYKFLEINEIEINKSIWFKQTNQAQPKPKTLSRKEFPWSNQSHLQPIQPSSPLACFSPQVQQGEGAEVEKVVDSANLVRRKYSEKPGLAENIWNKTKKMSFFSAKLFKIVKFKQNIGDKSISIHKQVTFWLKCL